jgi:DNA modification methylase
MALVSSTAIHEFDGLTLYVGDVLDALAQMSDESVQTCVTSPPYWGLRNYGVEGQLGLEATPDEYVAHMVEVFRAVRRVLRNDGTVWLNLGDSFNAAGRKGHGTRVGYKQQTNRASANGLDNVRPSAPSLKPKDLVGIPWRIAFALQDDGWYLRSDIIWHKSNPMPESVRDRPTKSHEYLFLLAKSQRYFYDADAISEPALWERWGDQTVPKHEGTDTAAGWIKPKKKTELGRATKNARSVWPIPTQSYKGAHFATFPEELARRCILAGTSEMGCCPDCGAPQKRETERERTFESGSGRSGNDPIGKNGSDLQGGGETRDVRRCPVTTITTTGWVSTCACESRFSAIPCTVLDPFLGSGTTAQVARSHGRHSIGIELNPEYVDLIAKRYTSPTREEKKAS